MIIFEIKNLEKSVSEATDSHLAGIGTLKIQVAGLHRAGPSAALDKKILFKACKMLFVFIYIFNIPHFFTFFKYFYIFFVFCIKVSLSKNSKNEIFP